MNDYNDDYKDTNDKTDDLEDRPSRTQIKNEMEALQKLGEKLQSLNPKTLDDIPMSERLRAGLTEGFRINQREARRRHLQFLGKLMRKEPNLDNIQTALDLLDSSSAVYTQRLHQCEQWRDRLVSESNDLLTTFLQNYPQADRQHLSQLIRNARKEEAQNKPPASKRKLFRYIRELWDEQQGVQGEPENEDDDTA